MKAEPISQVMVVEYSPVIRMALCRLIKSNPFLHVIGSTGDGREAVSMAADRAPNIIMMNQDLGHGLEGAELIRALKAVRPRVRMLIMTHSEHTLALRDLCLAGADVVVGRSIPTSIFFELLCSLTKKEFIGPVVYPHSKHGVDDNLISEELPMLSARERQLLGLIASGLNVREISTRLGIGRKTVESHRCNIRYKLGLKNTDELRQFARNHFGVILPREAL